MSIWDISNFEAPKKTGRGARRDVTKFGIIGPKKPGRNGKLYIPEHISTKAGHRIHYRELDGGMAFKFGTVGDYKICQQGSGTLIMFAQAPYALCRFAKGSNAVSIEVEELNGVYVCHYSQFE